MQLSNAKDKGLFVEFGVEDSTRTDFNVLLEILSMAEQEGQIFLELQTQLAV